MQTSLQLSDHSILNLAHRNRKCKKLLLEYLIFLVKVVVLDVQMIESSLNIERSSIALGRGEV